MFSHDAGICVSEFKLNGAVLYHQHGHIHESVSERTLLDGVGVEKGSKIHSPRGKRTVAAYLHAKTSTKVQHLCSTPPATNVERAI
jgi:ribosomal protein L19